MNEKQLAAMFHVAGLQLGERMTDREEPSTTDEYIFQVGAMCLAENITPGSMSPILNKMILLAIASLAKDRVDAKFANDATTKSTLPEDTEEDTKEEGQAKLL